MDDVHPVQHFKSLEKRDSHAGADSLLCHGLPLAQQPLQQVSTLPKLHDQPEGLAVLESVVQARDSWDPAEEAEL